MTDALSATFAALADPTRRAILARLSRGETSVGDLSKPFAMSAPAVTKHLKVLQRAGLISQGRQAQWRPCKLEAKPLMEAADWVAQYRQHWEERLDRLEDYLQTLQSTPPNDIPAASAAPAAAPAHPNATRATPRTKEKKP